jgi:hypothetical protein
MRADNDIWMLWWNDDALMIQCQEGSIRVTRVCGLLSTLVDGTAPRLWE